MINSRVIIQIDLRDLCVEMTLKAYFWTDFGLLGVGVRLDEHEGCVRLAARLDGLGAQTLAGGLHDDVRHLKPKRTRLEMTQNGSK